MSWSTLIPLIVQYGIPFAYDLWKVITEHPEPNEEAWTKLLALSQKSYDTYMAEAKARAGLTGEAQTPHLSSSVTVHLTMDQANALRMLLAALDKTAGHALNNAAGTPDLVGGLLEAVEDGIDAHL